MAGRSTGLRHARRPPTALAFLGSVLLAQQLGARAPRLRSGRRRICSRRARRPLPAGAPRALPRAHRRPARGVARSRRPDPRLRPHTRRRPLPRPTCRRRHRREHNRHHVPAGADDCGAAAQPLARAAAGLQRPRDPHHLRDPGQRGDPRHHSATRRAAAPPLASRRREPQRPPARQRTSAVRGQPERR